MARGCADRGGDVFPVSVWKWSQSIAGGAVHRHQRRAGARDDGLADRRVLRFMVVLLACRGHSRDVRLVGMYGGAGHDVTIPAGLWLTSQRAIRTHQLVSDRQRVDRHAQLERPGRRRRRDLVRRAGGVGRGPERSGELRHRESGDIAGRRRGSGGHVLRPRAREQRSRIQRCVERIPAGGDRGFSMWFAVAADRSFGKRQRHNGRADVGGAVRLCAGELRHSGRLDAGRIEPREFLDRFDGDDVHDHRCGPGDLLHSRPQRGGRRSQRALGRDRVRGRRLRDRAESAGQSCRIGKRIDRDADLECIDGKLSGLVLSGAGRLLVRSLEPWNRIGCRHESHRGRSRERHRTTSASMA